MTKPLPPVPRVPAWVPPLDTGQPSAEDLNNLGQMPKANFAAANQSIPITYGRDRLFGQAFVAHVNDAEGSLYLAMSFCEGQIAGYEKIIIDSSDALATGSAYEGLKNRGFENGDKTGWGGGGNDDGTVNNTVSRSGDWGLNIDVATEEVQDTDRLVAPPEGTRIRITGYAQRNSSPDENAFLAVRRNITAPGDPLTSAPVGELSGIGVGFNTADNTVAGWQKFEYVWTVPAGCYDYVLSALTNAGGTTGSWDFDDIKTEVINSDDEDSVIEVVAYVGTQTQQFDSLLHDTLTGYVDDLPGLAYIVMRCPVGSSRGFPRLEAIIQGRKVFDPRKYNLLYDDNDDHMFTTAGETVVADSKWFSSQSLSSSMGAPGWTTETADPSPAGATYAELIDNDDSTESVFSQDMPVDTSKTYTVTIYAKQPSGDRRNYLHVTFKDAAGTNIQANTDSSTGWDSQGTYYYWSIVNTQFAATWTKYTFTFGAGTANQFPQDTTPVTMSIGGLFSRDGAVGTATTVRIADYRVFEGSTEHVESDNTTWAYTQNPSICFRDMVANFTGWTPLDQGVADNANHNDELVSGVPRRQIGLTLGRVNTVDTWVKGFRAYMGAFLNWEGGKIRVIPNRPDVDAPGAVSLDATAGTWVDMGDAAELDFGTSSFTLEASFKAPESSVTNKAIVAKKQQETTLGAGYVLYMDTSGSIRFRIDDGTNQVTLNSSPAVFDDEEFHHVAIVVDQGGNTATMIIDDVEEVAATSIASVTGTTSNAVPFRVGALGNSGALFDGLIDEVRVWDDVRTPAELSANRSSEIANPMEDASLVGYWKMNEATSASVAVDSSRSANNGTLAGAAGFTFGNPQIIPDGVAMHITADDIVKDSLDLKRRSLRSVPNSVAVDYEDASGIRWFTSRTQADSPRVTSGDEARRLSRVSLPGVHNASQAQREATERLNWYLTDLECTLTLFDEGWELTHGSIVAVTHPIGLDAKLFRVRQTSSASGRWVVDMAEYDPAIYSDVVVADPTIPDTSLGDPLNPPTVTNLTLTEELFNYKTGTTGSRVRVTWDALGYPYLSQYLVEAYVDGSKVWQTFTGASNIVSPPVEEIVDTLGTPTDYEVRVIVQSPFAAGTAAIDNVQIDGKFAIPSDPTGAAAVQTFADGVKITWVAAVDIDIWRYEVRRGTTSDTWSSATSLVFVDGLEFAETGLALGTHRYFIKAIDSVKQESANAAFVDVTLSAPNAVTGLFGFEVASEVRLNWTAVTDGFAERYRIAYSDIPETFETTLDIVDTTRFQTKDVPEGTFTFKAYTQDKVGNEAATPATIDIEVTSDADAFLADSYDFVTPTLTNMVEWDIRTDDKAYYVTNMGDAFAVSPTDFVAADPLANYHSTGASEWLSETQDFGLALTGSWNLTQDVVALQGTVDIALELSTDDITYVSFGGSAKGEFRYARVRISTAASPGTATAFVKSPVMGLKINVVPLEESGSANSSPVSGTGKTINLTREYTALKEIVAQPKNTIATGSAVTAIVDNIVVGPNTAIQCNGTEYYSGGDWAEVEFGTGDFTIEFITKHYGGNGTSEPLIDKRSGITTEIGYKVFADYSNFEVGITIDDGTTPATVLTTGDALPNDGLPHHFACVVQRGATDLITWYVDSVAQTPVSISAVTGSLDNSILLRVFSQDDGSVAPNGATIDQVRIWDDARTLGEIEANWNKALDMTQTQSNLVHYLLCDGTIGDVTGNITDVTTNARTYTATGAGDNVYVDPGSGGPNVQKINSFDVFIFDTFGQQLGEEFQWKWKAV